MAKAVDDDGITTRRFAALVASRRPLRDRSLDWQEGFSKATDTTHTIGRSTGDSRVAHEAIAGMKDHVVDKVTGLVEETTIPLREGHGLADECRQLADEIDVWITAGNRLARRALKLMPVDHPVAMTMVKHQEVQLSGAGMCQRCGRDVPGIVESKIHGIKPDRLKSGFCFGQAPHCYAAWVASGRRDRKKFIQDWNAESGTVESAGASPETQNGVPSRDNASELSPGDGEA